MATRSPGLKSLDPVMILWTSVSNTLGKQTLFTCLLPDIWASQDGVCIWQSEQLFSAIALRAEEDNRWRRGYYVWRSDARDGSHTMPKVLRKRGKGHKEKRKKDIKSLKPRLSLPRKSLSRRRRTALSAHDGTSSGPSSIVSRASASDSNQDQVDPKAPFGHVEPEMKAYFGTVEDQLKEWQQNWGASRTRSNVRRARAGVVVPSMMMSSTREPAGWCANASSSCSSNECS